MTSRERKLRIENHPDKWGGDHSRMKKVFKMKSPRSKHSFKHCRVCGVATRTDACALHYRVRKLVNIWTVFIPLVALVMCSNAAQVVPGVQMATTSSLTLPTSTATFKQTVLTWDNPLGASNRVAWGGARYSWTNSASVSTNQFNVTNGTHYAVYAMLGGIESIPALWPSNRIGELWLTGMETNFTGGTNIQKLCSFTNQPPGQMRFWGVANITTGWE